LALQGVANPIVPYNILFDNCVTWAQQIHAAAGFATHFGLGATAEQVVAWGSALVGTQIQIRPEIASQAWEIVRHPDPFDANYWTSDQSTYTPGNSESLTFEKSEFESLYIIVSSQEGSVTSTPPSPPFRTERSPVN
jgi:hypothetical protein